MVAKWEKIDQDLVLNKFAHGMPGRVQAIIANSGGNIK